MQTGALVMPVIHVACVETVPINEAADAGVVHVIQVRCRNITGVKLCIPLIVWLLKELLVGLGSLLWQLTVRCSLQKSFKVTVAELLLDSRSYMAQNKLQSSDLYARRGI